MEERDILLRIHRQYSPEEAYGFLHHYISVLKQHIEALEGELADAKVLTERLREAKTLTKKQWLQEEIFEEINQQLQKAQQKAVQHKKDAEHWQKMYFRLLNSRRENP